MRINITFPDDKLNVTDEYADLLGLSRSAFIAMCVSHYIATVFYAGHDCRQSKSDTCDNR